MAKYFVPVNNVRDFSCYSVYDKDTIRAYYNNPSYNSSSNYVDFYVNSHYLQKTGTQTWGSGTYTTLPTCINTSDITNDVYYRNDLPDILIIFVIMFLFIFYIPFKLIRRPFGKWFKL